MLFAPSCSSAAGGATGIDAGEETTPAALGSGFAGASTVRGAGSGAVGNGRDFIPKMSLSSAAVLVTCFFGMESKRGGPGEGSPPPWTAGRNFRETSQNSEAPVHTEIWQTILR